jgi:hypothetical protein
MVQFETNRYSVPTDYAHETVLIKAFERQGGGSFSETLNRTPA